ncbi:UNVERIFIED_ORG: hypothetical protein J2791_004039 [Burkholderia contaminans]|nr:hypothetical protein [Burkholderia contaminans]
MAVIHRAPRPAPNGAARIRAPRHEVNDGTGMHAMIAHGIAEAHAWDGADQGSASSTHRPPHERPRAHPPSLKGANTMKRLEGKVALITGGARG